MLKLLFENTLHSLSSYPYVKIAQGKLPGDLRACLQAGAILSCFVLLPTAEWKSEAERWEDGKEEPYQLLGHDLSRV